MHSLALRAGISDQLRSHGCANREFTLQTNILNHPLPEKHSSLIPLPAEIEMCGIFGLGRSTLAAKKTSPGGWTRRPERRSNRRRFPL
jgi:hypothetical protein